jgi:phosphatidylglycerophosphate synthase
MNQDLAFALILFTLTGLVALAYWIRTFFKGKARFDRVERQGGSSLLSKELMQGGYWFFQPLAKFLVLCRITPNVISWASLGFGVLAGACLSQGHFGFGAFFATFSAVFDALDGLVARMTGVSSDAGEVLDATVDRYVEFFFLGGLVIYYREIPVLLALALFALAGSFMVSYSTAKAEALQIDPPKGNMRRPERAIYLILGAALSPITIPWFERIREYPIAIGHPMVAAVALIAVLSNLSAIERLYAVSRVIREREAKARGKRSALSPSSSDTGAGVRDDEASDPLHVR